jgi:hypothetical protein
MTTPFMIAPYNGEPEEETSEEGGEFEESTEEFYPREEILGGHFSQKRLKAQAANAYASPELPPALLDPDEEPDEGVQSLLMEKQVASLAQSPVLQALIKGAMEGTLPLSKPLQTTQPKKLNSRALQVVMLRLAGYNGPEIASITGFHKVYVQAIMRHPYAKKIFIVAGASAIAQSTATSRHLRRKAPKMLKVVHDLAMSPLVEAPTRLRAAFGWLDRAGIGPVTKHEVENTHKGGIMVTEGHSKLIATAIREASGVGAPAQEVDFTVIEEARQEQRESNG